MAKLFGGTKGDNSQYVTRTGNREMESFLQSKNIRVETYAGTQHQGEGFSVSFTRMSDGEKIATVKLLLNNQTDEIEVLMHEWV